MKRGKENLGLLLIRRLLQIGVLSIIFTVFGCDSEPDPWDIWIEDLLGTYTLKSVGGQPLPAILGVESDHTIHLIDAKIVLAWGAVHFSKQIERVYTNGDVIEQEVSFHGTWNIRAESTVPPSHIIAKPNVYFGGQTHVLKVLGDLISEEYLPWTFIYSKAR